MIVSRKALFALIFLVAVGCFLYLIYPIFILFYLAFDCHDKVVGRHYLKETGHTVWVYQRSCSATVPDSIQLKIQTDKTEFKPSWNGAFAVFRAPSNFTISSQNRIITIRDDGSTTQIFNIRDNAQGYKIEYLGFNPEAFPRFLQ